MCNFAKEQNWTMDTADLPSRRWKDGRIRTAKDKKLRKLEKEWYKLHDEIRNLGYKPLETPIRCGYKRLFILTEDTKHSTSPEFYQGILDKINDIRYSPIKEFEVKRTSKRWRRRKRKRKEQKLLEPDSYCFRHLKFSEDEKRMFYEVTYYDKVFKKNKIKYVFSEPWRFALSIRPHWITEIRLKNSILEQQIEEINKITNQYKHRGRLVKMRGGNRYSWKKSIERQEDRKLYAYSSLQNKPLHLIVAAYKEEKQLWEYDQKN